MALVFGLRAAPRFVALMAMLAMLAVAALMVAAGMVVLAPPSPDGAPRHAT